jgi:hypothetical protein
LQAIRPTRAPASVEEPHKNCISIGKVRGARRRALWHTAGQMHESYIRALNHHRRTLRSRWEVLLRAERINSPLANPDTLVFLMDYTLDRLLDELRSPRQRRRRSPDERPPCPCGRNPLLAYFQTAEQAMIETLFLNESELAICSPEERHVGLEELRTAVREVGRREIESFCAVCQHQPACPPLPAAI